MGKQRNDNIDERKAFKVCEVAGLLGVSRQKVYDWITDGHLRARVFPKSLLLILREDLDDFLSGMEAA